MKTADISDAQVVEACLSYHDDLAQGLGKGRQGISVVRLMTATSSPEKVARSAMERAYARGLVEVGMGIDWAWPTEAGLSLVNRDQVEASPSVARSRAFQAELDNRLTAAR